MEICRKLDSIRTAGFPERISGALARVAATDGPPPRPSSEPKPDFVTEVPEQRPDTAVSASHILATRDAGRLSVIEGGETAGEKKIGDGEGLSAPSPGSQNLQPDLEEKHDADEINEKLDKEERTVEQLVRFGGKKFYEKRSQGTLENKPGIESTAAETIIKDKAESGRRRQKKVRASSRALRYCCNSCKEWKLAC